MGRLRIVAGGDSQQSSAQKRGKLFEKLMAEVLRRYGYKIDRIANVNYAGMEIDIEGSSIVAGTPLYAECKCYATEIDAPKLQSFYGKYMTFWFKERRCQGLFIALPGINSYAKAFYNENCEGNNEITIRLLQEEEVLDSIFQVLPVVRPEVIYHSMSKKVGHPGDYSLCYTEKGFFYIQDIIPSGGTIPSSYCILDGAGNIISEKASLDFVKEVCPELKEMEMVTADTGVFGLQQSTKTQESEEIVEVKGSSECFEYQFPASPEHFVGRVSVLKEFKEFVNRVLNKETSCRGILFEANSGWGKSSIVLSAVDLVKKQGHFAVAIDSRAVSTSQFILKVLDHALRKFDTFDGNIGEHERVEYITGFEGAMKTMINLANRLEAKGKLLFIFLDQFENVFFHEDALTRIVNLLLKCADAQTNIVFGFSWKTDLVGTTDDFPYRLRDVITSVSNRITLDTFTELETTTLLDRLGNELHTTLRADLRFFLSEFSQGYPWLLKKLCAHVKAQRENGIPQSDIANRLLNVEQLFKEDLHGLTIEEENTLRKISKMAPISVSELGEEFKPSVVQTLVNRRLVVRVGIKYDIYWDIFRDYLNTGRLPIRENYILRAQVGSVLNATKIMVEANGILDTAAFQERARLSEKSIYNVFRDMNLLGIAEVKEGNVILDIELPKQENEWNTVLREHLKERLQRNRIIWKVICALKEKESISTNDLSELLKESCPYISASKTTWLTYARVLQGWMDAADLGILNIRNRTLSFLKPGKEVRERKLVFAKRHGTRTPRIQYAPILEVAKRLVDALSLGKSID